MNAKPDPYTMREVGYPNPTSAPTTMVTALRIAKRYRGRVPTHHDLIREYGFSRATAYRWAKAIRDEWRPA